MEEKSTLSFVSEALQQCGKERNGENWFMAAFPKRWEDEEVIQVSLSDCSCLSQGNEALQTDLQKPGCKTPALNLCPGTQLRLIRCHSGFNKQKHGVPGELCVGTETFPPHRCPPLGAGAGNIPAAGPCLVLFNLPPRLLPACN